MADTVVQVLNKKEHRIMPLSGATMCMKSHAHTSIAYHLLTCGTKAQPGVTDGSCAATAGYHTAGLRR